MYAPHISGTVRLDYSAAMRVAVRPIDPSSPRPKKIKSPQARRDPRRQPGLRSVPSVLYHWLLWAFFTLLLFGQLLGIAWTRVTYTTNVAYGRDLSLGPFQVLGSNDVPFTDRSYVCARRGRVYRPVQLAQALGASSSVIVDRTGSAVNGYRVVKRDVGFRIDGGVMKGYKSTCNAIADTLEAVLDRCTELGYNVTRDHLRVVVDDSVGGSGGDDIASTASSRSVMKIVGAALPVLILPFSDNSLYARYAIPGWDGSACVVRLNGAYETEGLAHMTMRGLNRSVRERRTAELLGRPGGTWRNGWYEDRGGGRWFSDLMTSEQSPLGIALREFDMLRNLEADCATTGKCGVTSRTEHWGPKISTVALGSRRTDVSIMNGTLFGEFQVLSLVAVYVTSVYDLEGILANLSLGVLLIRWAVAMVALTNSYSKQNLDETEQLRSASIGVLACARGFYWLPIMLLPRLKTNLAVFASIGCAFEGSQGALAQAWYLMYPHIAELVFFVFSLLNLLAKLLRRRMSDTFFGPTLLFYCAAHYFRVELAHSGWFEYDGRIVTVVPSAQFESMSALDLLTGDTLLKLNGNVKSLFVIKIAVLALNAVPLLLSRPAAPTPTQSASSAGAAAHATMSETELTLALHSKFSGGLGARVQRPFSPQSLLVSPSLPTNSRHQLSSYDMLRLGYVVVDDSWLMSISDWLLFAPLASFGLLRLVSLRVMVFAVRRGAVRQEGGATCSVVEKKPVLCQMSDPRIARCRPWAISSGPFG